VDNIFHIGLLIVLLLIQRFSCILAPHQRGYALQEIDVAFIRIMQLAKEINIINGKK
jgi:hypothetical protein